MGLESVTWINDLVTTNPVGATDPKSAGDDHIRNIKTALKNCFPGLTGRTFRQVAKSSNFTLALTDNYSFMSCSGTWTMDMTALATIGNGFYAIIANLGSGVVTLDPNGAETINNKATYAIQPGEWVILLSGLFTWYTISVDDVKRMKFATASGTNTYSASFNPSLVVHPSHALIEVTFTNGNTAASTFNPDSLGAKNIVKINGLPLASGEIPSGHRGLLLYDDTNYVIINPVVISASGTMTQLFAFTKFS